MSESPANALSSSSLASSFEQIGYDCILNLEFDFKYPGSIFSSILFPCTKKGLHNSSKTISKFRQNASPVTCFISPINIVPILKESLLLLKLQATPAARNHNVSSFTDPILDFKRVLMMPNRELA